MCTELIIGGGGWVSASVAIHGDPLELLRRQAGIPAPAKLAPGLALKAEMPIEGDPAESIATVRNSLERAAEALAKGPDTSVRMEPRRPCPEAVGRVLRECASECAAEADGFIVQAEGLKVAVEITDGVIFRTDLVPLLKLEGDALRALAHFSLALNARLRFARASFLDDRLALEVAIPLSALTPTIVRKALGSLRIGVEVARKECAALADERTAALYLGFHQEE